MAQGPDTEKALEEIRREVIESRNVTIKADNLLKNLHAELKLLGKQQEEGRKHQWVSSAVAYVLFAALCTGAAIMVSAARSSSATAEKEKLEKQAASLGEQLEKQKADQVANAQAERAAAEVYKLMTTLPGDERLKGIDALAKLDQSRLSSLEKIALEERAGQLKKEIGQAAFERGRAAFRRNDFPSAALELERYLVMSPNSEEALDACFFLGASLLQIQKPDKAVAPLARFVKEDRKSKTRDYGMLLLAQAYEQTRQFELAIATAQEALATYPASEFAPLLRARLSSAKRGSGASTTPAQPAAPGAPAPSPAPAAPAPVPSPAPQSPPPAAPKPGP